MKNRMAFNRRVAVAVMGIVFGLSLAAQNGETFKARLSPLPADARTRADLAGSGAASAVLSGTKLAITGSFEGLRTAATTASLHGSVAAGVRGPAIGDLTISKATSGTITGSIELTPQQLTSLRKGGLYVQIHSEKAPDGVLWGWLLR
jgi:DNA-binding transcriptional regulator YdaS (Cro superfamily)